MTDQEDLTDVDKEALKVIEWSMGARDLIVLLQLLHTYRETNDERYLQEALKELLELSVNDDYKDYKVMLDDALKEMEGYIVSRDSDKLAEIEGSIEGIFGRILYETHPRIMKKKYIRCGGCPRLLKVHPEPFDLPAKALPPLVCPFCKHQNDDPEYVDLDEIDLVEADRLPRPDLDHP